MAGRKEGTLEGGGQKVNSSSFLFRRHQVLDALRLASFQNHVAYELAAVLRTQHMSVSALRQRSIQFIEEIDARHEHKHVNDRSKKYENGLLQKGAHVFRYR